MRRSPRILLAAILVVLGLGALATPVAAANPKLTIVDGRPGPRIDVCLNGHERKSGMRYGSKVFRSVPAGTLHVKVFKRHAGNCRGRLLLKTHVNLVADDGVTLVITRKAPKLVRFDNDLGSTPQYSDVYFRHAADVGPAMIGLHVRSIGILSPAAPTAFAKGDQTFIEITNAEIQALAETLQGRLLARSPWIATPITNSAADTYGNTHIEFILVGTNKRNARFVAFQRAAPAP